MARLSFTCPFCFEQVKTSDIQHRCHNGWCPAGKEPDAEYQRYIGSGSVTSLGHIVSVQNKGLPFARPKLVMCDSCGQPTLQICPRCHNTLPDSTVVGEDNIISIVGTRSSGKSHYIAVLINELQRRIAPALGASVQSFVDMSGAYNADDLYKKTKYNKLYEQQEILEMTQGNLGGALEDDKRPLVYTFDYIRKVPGRSDNFTLAFLDAAGEDLQNPQLAATVSRYIAHSKGIIFLIDPLQIPDVFALAEGTPGYSSKSTGSVADSSPDAVLANISTLIRESRNMKRSKPIDIPVAITFSKFDQIQPFTSEAVAVQQTSPHCQAGMFSKSDWQNVDAEMRSLLDAWGQASFIAQAEAHYKNFSFFAVSSLGLNNAPNSEGKIHKPHPHRVEDPLLWIMSQNNLLKTFS